MISIKHKKHFRNRSRSGTGAPSPNPANTHVPAMKKVHKEGGHPSEEKFTLVENITLIQVLQDELLPPFDLKSFQEFVALDLTEENLNFWKEVSIFKESPNYLLESKAKKIYKSYIKSQSEQEVNLSSAQKADILDNLKKIFQDPVKKELRFDHVSEWQFQEDDNDPVWSKRRALFDDAQMEIFNLMKMDVFPRFMHKVSTFQKLSLAKDLALWWKSTEALTVSSFFTFPTEINAAEGRCVAAMTVTTVFVTLLVDVYFSQPWVGMYVLYNFIVRVVSGPRLSPDSFIALFVLRPLMVRFKVLEDEFVNGTPRRFAQCVGMIWSAMCIALRLSVSQSPWISWIFWLILAVLSSSVVLFDFCVACAIWHALEMIQVISKPCEPCSANKVCVKSSSDSINKQTNLGRLVPNSYLVKVAPTTCCVSEP